MPTINRYTQYAPARYTPRTLQELMVAPAYMRKQHNALDENIAQAETALAQIDNDPLHDPLVKQRQQELYNQLQSQAETLQSEGFNPANKSAFLRFNKEYQTALGPKGILGRAQAYKKSKITNRDSFMQNMTKEGYSAEDAGKYWKDYVSTEEGKFDGKNITNLNPLYGPKYVDLNESIDNTLKNLGSKTTGYIKDKNYYVEKDPSTGMLVFMTPSGQVVNSSNDENLKYAQKALNDEWFNQSGFGYKSNQVQKLSDAFITNTINNKLGVARTTKNIDTSGYNYQFKEDPSLQTDKNGRLINFYTNKIQGYNAANIDPNSPILGLDQIDNAKFVNGNLDISNNKYNTYKEKVDDLTKNTPKELVHYDNKTGLYYVKQMNQKSGNYYDLPISKDNNHLKNSFNELRESTPFFKDMNDEQIKNTLQNYKENLDANFVETIDPIQSNYEYLNDRLFGSEKGGGENSAGTIQNLGATINGSQLTSDEVLDNLGYDNYTDLKDEGKPAIKGYVPALGKWQVSVTNNDGNYKNLYIEAPRDMNVLFDKTQKISEAMLQAKPFAVISQDQVPKLNIDNQVEKNPDGTTATENMTAYMINDFDGDPLIIYSKNPNITNPNDLVNYIPTAGGGFRLEPKITNEEISKYGSKEKAEKAAYSRIISYKSMYEAEKYQAKQNSYYRDITGKNK